MRFQEIEGALSHLKTCPKCNSSQGFWLGVKSDKTYMQCKECGAQFEISEVYILDKKRREQKKFDFLKK